MKKFILIAGLAAQCLLANGQDNLVGSLKNNASDSAKLKFKFIDAINLSKTDVKDQGSSGTCWSYSGNSFLESELLRMGKPLVDISEIYTARCAYIERARNYVRMHGGISWGDGAELHDVLAIYKKYGAMPYTEYTGLNYGTKKNKFGEMQAALEGMLKGIVTNPNGKLTKNWEKAFTAALDAYLGAPPAEFKYGGKTHTPQSFAKEYVGINPDDYMEFSNYTYVPHYTSTVMMVPDNWSLQSVWNLPLNELTSTVDNALKKGYTVAWATDVSEKYFSWKNGVAIVPEKELEDMDSDEIKTMFDGPKTERTITEQYRQEAFDNYSTQDDHGMHIVGLAKDQNGKEYYIVKNSWGEKNDYKGYLYVSKAFFQYKTTAIVVHKDAVDKGVLAKLRK
jgi:bleomycin hydrolase